MISNNIPKLRLSHSALDLWNTCQRKFLIQRYTPGSEERQDNVDFSFGKAFEAGVVSLLKNNGDINQARLDTFLAYNPLLETPKDLKYKAPKTLEVAMLAVEAFKEEWEFSRWELLKDQLSFKIILNSRGDYYCGFVDAVLRDRETQLLTVGETKTTGLMVQDPAILYRNSPQGLGYSVVLQPISQNATSFISLYIVAQMWRGEVLPRIHFLPFSKPVTKRLDWLIELHLQAEEIHKAFEYKSFRQNYLSCYKFSRECQFYGVCDSSRIYDVFIEPDEDEEDWDYIFHFDDLVKGQA